MADRAPCKMPFGKFKDIDIALVSSGYLKWLVRQDWFVMKQPEALVLAVERELEWRDTYNEHFYEDKVKPRG